VLLIRHSQHPAPPRHFAVTAPTHQDSQSRYAHRWIEKDFLDVPVPTVPPLRPCHRSDSLIAPTDCYTLPAITMPAVSAVTVPAVPALQAWQQCLWCDLYSANLSRRAITPKFHISRYILHFEALPVPAVRTVAAVRLPHSPANITRSQLIALLEFSYFPA